MSNNNTNYLTIMEFENYYFDEFYKYLAAIVGQVWHIPCLVLCLKFINVLLPCVLKNHVSINEVFMTNNIVTIIFGIYQFWLYIRHHEFPPKQQTHFMLLLVFYLNILVRFIFESQNRLLDFISDQTKLFDNIMTLIVYFDYQLSTESTIFFTQDLKQLRGILMVYTMRRIYFANRPKSLHMFTQLTHPSSSILGPWYVKAEQESYNSNEFNKLGLQSRLCFKYIFYALACLIYSDIVVEFLTENIDEYLSDYVWIQSVLTIYLKGTQFRFYYYHLCQFANGLFSLFTDDDYQMTRPKLVEWPRSFASIAINLNIPLYFWLRQFVFWRLSNATDSKLILIMCTYTFSAMLHGFKFQVWAVLLTLGLLSWSEHLIREKLSDVFDACILTKPCPLLSNGLCTNGHRNREKNSFKTRLINLTFTLLTIWHLTYLSYVFRGNTDDETIKQSLKIWRGVYFFGHWTTLVYLIGALFCIDMN